jgi:hypothetical protein
MYIFIDESGIHKQDGESTTALVYVKVGDKENMDKAILAVERDLKIEPFHWKKQTWKIRKVFLTKLLKENFEVKIFLLKNPFTQEKQENALKHMLIERHIRNIIIDGKKPQRYVLRLKKILRDFGVSVKKIRMGNDQSFPGLRLADLFAGLTRAYFQNFDNQEAKILYNMAKIKITTQLMGGQTAG